MLYYDLWIQKQECKASVSCMVSSHHQIRPVPHCTVATEVGEVQSFNGELWEKEQSGYWAPQHKSWHLPEAVDITMSSPALDRQGRQERDNFFPSHFLPSNECTQRVCCMDRYTAVTMFTWYKFITSIAHLLTVDFPPRIPWSKLYLAEVDVIFNDASACISQLSSGPSCRSCSIEAFSILHSLSLSGLMLNWESRLRKQCYLYSVYTHSFCRCHGSLVLIVLFLVCLNEGLNVINHH